MLIKTINTPKGKTPDIQLHVQRCEANQWENLGFAGHHYLTQTLNKSCKCLLFSWGDTPVAFAALLNTPKGGHPYYMAISRLVILPDFQGLGLSKTICNFCGGIIKALSDETHEYKLFIKTANDTMGHSLERNKSWQPTVYNKKTRSQKAVLDAWPKYKNCLERWSYCYAYEGEAIKGYEELLLPIKALREKRLGQLSFEF